MGWGLQWTSGQIIWDIHINGGGQIYFKIYLGNTYDPTFKEKARVLFYHIKCLASQFISCRTP